MKSTTRISIDEQLKNLIPKMRKSDRGSLESEIIAAGRALEPLTVWKGHDILIDGHNRYDICKKNNLPFDVVYLDFDDKLDVMIWMRRHQTSRRNLTNDQRAANGAELVKLLSEKAKQERAAKAGKVGGKVGGRNHPKTSSGLSVGATDKPEQPSTKTDTRKDVATEAGVSERQMQKAIRLAKDSPDLSEKVVDGLLSLDDALAISKVKDEGKRDELLESVLSGECKNAKAAANSLNKSQAINTIKSLSFPEGKFGVIVADPPWKYESRAEDISHRAANPYPTMTADQLKEWTIDGRHVSELAHDDCVLWMWTTNAFMVEAHEIVEEWGFTVKTILTWVKDKMGTGDWLRGKTEHCLLCVKGKPVVNSGKHTTVLNGPLREHSRKPDEFYVMVEDFCPATARVELFSREPRDGWVRMGAESEKFAGVAA